MEGLFHILEGKYAEKNAHFWEQKLLLLLLLIKKYVLIKKQVFFTQKRFSGIKYFDQNLHKLGWSKHEILSSIFEV